MNTQTPESNVQKKKPGRAPYAEEQVDTSFCMIKEVRQYLARDEKVVTEEVRRLLAEANVETDAVDRVRHGRTPHAKTVARRRSIRLSVEDQAKFAALGGSSWLRVAVEKEMAANAKDANSEQRLADYLASQKRK